MKVWVLTTNGILHTRVYHNLNDALVGVGDVFILHDWEPVEMIIADENRFVFNYAKGFTVKKIEVTLKEVV